MKKKRITPKRKYQKQVALPKLDGTAIQASPRVIASRRNGSLGGQATAARYGAEFREQVGRKDGQTTLALYGHSYYSDHFKRIWKNRKAKQAAERAKGGK